MCYLTVGKPILATETVQAAGFHDLPNALISSRADSVREALEICPDLEIADQYLKERSPIRRAQTLAAIANNDLFFRGTRDPSGGASMDREAELVPAPSATSERNGQPTVLLETLSLHRGGLERVVADMASTLNGAGFRSVISTIQEGGDIANTCRAAGIRTYQVGRDTKKFQRILDTEKADLLISHYSNFGAASAASRGTPVISVIQNSYIWHSPEQDAEVRAADRSVTRYLAVSKSARTYLCRKYKIEPSRVVCIPNGADLATLRGAEESPPVVTRRSLNIPDDSYVFTQVAGFYGTKAQLHTVSALRKVMEQFPNVRVLLVGARADQEYWVRVRDYVHHFGLHTHVMFCGQTNRVWDYYRLADACIAPSLIEGWSLAVNEAMFFGLPLLLTKVGSADEVIVNEDVGITIPAAYHNPLALNASNIGDYCNNPEPRNHSALVEAMIRFCRDPELWRERGRRGSEKLVRQFNSELIGLRYVELVKEVLDAAPASRRRTSWNARASIQ